MEKTITITEKEFEEKWNNVAPANSPLANRLHAALFDKDIELITLSRGELNYCLGDISTTENQRQDCFKRAQHFAKVRASFVKPITAEDFQNMIELAGFAPEGKPAERLIGLMMDTKVVLPYSEEN